MKSENEKMPRLDRITRQKEIKTMTDIMVSICCTAYNHENYIEDAIESFLMQKTNFPVEIIIHDDASTDKTVEIINLYQSKYPDIIKPVFQLENQYSKGIKILSTYIWPKARGKYIALCEGDDYWIDPHKLQKQVDYMEKDNECRLCFHSTKVVLDNKVETGILIKPHNENIIFTSEEIINMSGYFHTSSLMFQKKDVESLPDFYLRASVGDYPLALFLTSKGYAYYINEILSAYRTMVPGSWTTRTIVNGNIGSRIKNYQDVISILEGFNKYSDKKYEKYIDKVILKLEIDILILKKDRKRLKEPKYQEYLNTVSAIGRLRIFMKLNFPILYPKIIKKSYRINAYVYKIKYFWNFKI